MKNVLFTFVLLLCTQLYAQTESQLKEIQPNAEYENIHVQKLNSDSAQTSFVIWIKKAVKAHYHAFHTENIYVIEGKAEMTLNDSTFVVRKGDYLNIPKGSIHSVTKVYGKKPLKVLSIQSPEFRGKDRIFVESVKQQDEDY
jgi:mannose-6-phosphate isomerase-like protein (cupin superfamily)